MSISRIKQIKRVLSDADVRYPNNTIDAIRAVVTQPKAEKPADPAKPVATIRVFNSQDSGKPLGTKIVVEFSKTGLEPRHLIATIASLQDMGDEVFGGGDGECDDPNCPVHGVKAGIESHATTDLGELFKKFEEDAIKAAASRRVACNERDRHPRRAGCEARVSRRC